MSTTLLLITGCIVFAVTTLASLWAGYLLLQQAWVNQNPELTREADNIHSFFAKAQPERPRVSKEA